MEAEKPQGSGMRGPVGVEPTGCTLIEDFFLPYAVFVQGEEVLGFAKEVILWKKNVVNNFVGLQSVLKYNLLNQISYINVSNNA